MKVAILQDRVGVGGRSKVLAEIIRVLNQYGIVPDLLTFSTQSEVSKFESAHAITSDRSIATVSVKMFKTIRGIIYQSMLLNLAVRRRLKKYFLIVTSNNCPYWLPQGPHYIHYVHHPLEADLLYNKRYSANLAWKLYAALPLVAFRYSKFPTKNHAFIANSEFTKKRMFEVWRIKSSQIEVIYPPTVELKDITPKEVRDEINHVVSLGFFIPDKRQLEQITIAQNFPYLKFCLIGKIASSSYFKRCQKKLKKFAVNNVVLLSSLINERVWEKLRVADVFLHTKEDEHFGISTVEAIASGCIPLVHNSGGQREIVPIPELRFISSEEAIKNLALLINHDADTRYDYINALQQHIKKFTINAFRKKFLKILHKFLDDAS